MSEPVITDTDFIKIQITFVPLELSKLKLSTLKAWGEFYSDGLRLGLEDTTDREFEYYPDPIIFYIKKIDPD